MVGALCFGTVFGFPFIVWGLFLMFDRDLTWQKKLEKSKSKQLPTRTSAWDKRQKLYGAMLVVFGTAILVSFTLFNLAAQSISPTLDF